MKIGIIIAMEKEMRKYHELYKLELVNSKFNIYKFNYDDKELFLVKCGVGKVNSSLITQYLIDTYQVDLIINSGCAGSLTDKVKVMDTIIVDAVTYHDFSPIEIMEKYIPENGKIKVNSLIIESAQVIANKSKLSYHIGGIASGDSFITDSKMRDDIFKRTNCLAVDMESMSIAQVSKLNNVAFLIVRTISDFADGNEEQEEKASNISAQFVIDFIKNL